ncbi:L-Aspartase-like protein [Emericellopsis atlantica]|uniref:Adenylosuccinate lyase n=1 Tax=Emericellopsis atlantica TaxID=2614577 RepID=A0A9P8CNK1_9HYPO|nr:L-Aspartase-like protein [Emericellopsis atlantica]KAG9253155.1 L-Aspartase-like protein [Emericellopsis atlantica]
MAATNEAAQAKIEELQQQIEQLQQQAQGSTTSSFDVYSTSLTSRYCSKELTFLFSQRSRHSTWRKLWLGLAEAESELGVTSITPEALKQMREALTVTDKDFEAAKVEEKIRRHDVMAHVHAFGLVAPAAAGIIHLGATSCFVTDNAELILMRDALDILINKMAKVISNLQAFSLQWKSEPTLAYTHLQSAQPITVGRRSAQWVQDLVMDLEALEAVRKGLRFRGAQGTTGTQASFLEIFEGDHEKCLALNEKLCQRFGFPSCYDISTQTYTRKVDTIVANAVAGIGASASKIAGDLRHLASWKEIDEPSEKSQIGSSAMAYKKNPMRCERVSSLSRVLMSKTVTFNQTHATQWMERSLDDSACRRIDIPEMFLLAEAILIGLDNVSAGLVVYPGSIRAHYMSELPFMLTEAIIMKLVAKGASRQEAHEHIRVLSQEAAKVVKVEGKPNDMIERIRNSEYFKPIWGELDDMMKPELYIGRSVQIVDKYCGPAGPVEKALAPYQEYISGSATAELNV